MRRQIDNSLFEMALIGYEAERQKIEAAIAAIQRELGGRPKRAAEATAEGAEPQPKRKMSAAARKRIGEAQKKRWAAFHARKPVAMKKAAPRKAVSADVKQKRIAALAKARAAKAAKKAAQQSAA